MFYSDKLEKWVIGPGFVFTPEFCEDMTHWIAISLLNLIDRYKGTDRLVQTNTDGYFEMEVIEGEVYTFTDDEPLSNVWEALVEHPDRPYFYETIDAIADCPKDDGWAWEFMSNFVEGGWHDGTDGEFDEAELMSDLLSSLNFTKPSTAFLPCETIGDLRMYVDWDIDMRHLVMEHFEKELQDHFILNDYARRLTHQLNKSAV